MAPPEVTSPAAGLARRLARYSIALGILGASAIGLTLAQLGGKQSFGDQTTSIGLNLVSSALFALLFSVITSSEQERWLSHALADQFAKLSREMQDEIQSVNTLHVPTEQYQPTETFDERFNSHLMTDLSLSSCYIFRGISAKYVAARVHAGGQRLTQLKVITLDPTARSAMLRRSVDRRSNPKYSDKSVDDLVEEIRSEILMSIVSLFDCRNICTVELALVAETAVQRVELFDSNTYVSFYHSVRASRMPYPETMRYANRSLMYETCRLDAYRRVEIADKLLRFSSDQTDQDLSEMLTSIVGLPMSEAEIREQRRKYATWSTPFMAKLRHL